MKRFACILLALILSLSLFSACTTKEPSPKSTDNLSPQETEKGDIVIGNIQDLSGSSSTWGISYQYGAELAAAEINAAGGIDGRMIKIVGYDCKGDVNEGINAYNRLCQEDGAVAVMGLISNVGLALAPLSETTQVPLVSDFMDERCTTKEDGTPYEYMFLTEPSCNQQAIIMADYAMKKLNGGKAAVLYDSTNAYCTSHAEPFKEYVESNGGEVVAYESFQTTDKDYRAQLTKIKNANPDVIYVSGYSQANALAYTQARQMGLECPILGNNSFFIPFADLVTDVDVYDVYHPNNVSYEDAAIKTVVDKYKAEKGNDPSYHIFFGYDNVHIIVDAIKRAGSTEGPKLAKSLEATKDLQCLTGKISIDPATHRPTGLSMWITEVKDNEYLPLELYYP